jgi:phosphatidylserine/phosphatidylglycerophosphate/cardiolipin synthase-like enzyme
LRFARDQFIFNQREFERRYVRAAEFIGERTPPSAIVLAAQHSGSVRYYSHRLTLRYDALSADRLDRTLQELKEKGHHPYLVLDDFEQQDFRSRFAMSNRAGRLDWSPLFQVASDPRVYIYDLDGRGDER